MTNAVEENKSSFIKGHFYGRRAFIVKLFVSISILGYLAYVVDWSSLWAMIAKVNLMLFTGAVLVMSLPIALTSLRWQIILRSQNLVIRIREVISFDLIALFFNSVLPGSTGGDMVRAVLAIRLFPREKTRIILSLLTDRGIGLLVLMIFAWLVLWIRPEIVRVSPLLQSVGKLINWTLFAAISALLIVAISRQARTMPWAQGVLQFLKRNAVIDKILSYVSPFLSRPLLLIGLAGVTVVSYSCNFFSGYLLAKALHLPMSYLQVVLLLAVVTVAISIPITVSGHGVREIVIIGMFSTLAIDVPALREAAIAYSILLFGIQLIWSLIGGVYFLSHRGQLDPKWSLTPHQDRAGIP